jgi:FkbM family methyltransferase
MENELNSEKSFNIVDVGSDNDTLEKVVNYLSCPQNIYCINPNKKDLDNLEIYYKKYNKVNIKKLNYAVSEFSGKINFYVTKDDTASSIYEPNQEILTRYRKDNIFDVVEKKEIHCENLDNVFNGENIKNIDLLLLLCQASELNIIKGGEKILEKVSVIHADASFIEKYKGQPLFDDYISYLNKNNFKFIGFTHTRSVDGNLIEVRALFLNKHVNKNNNIINAARILMHYNFFWEAKWLLHDNNFEKKIYNKLVNIKMKKKKFLFIVISSIVLKIMSLKNGYLKKILYPLIPIIKKVKIGRDFLVHLDSANQNTK